MPSGNPIYSSEVTVVDYARRSEERRFADLRARYGTSGRPERALCRVLDVSKHGARLEVYCDLPVSTTITLMLPHSGTVKARVVWAKEFEAGCRFLEPISENDISAIFSKGHA